MNVRRTRENGTDWLEFAKLIPQLLWIVLAAIALAILAPDFRSLLRTDEISKIGIGVIQIELARVPSKLKKDSDSDHDLGGEGVLSQISKADRDRISERFREMSQKTKGASLLWVHNKHPYQNVLERRVLVAAAINVDIAKSTEEALSWLAQSNYDVVVTNLNRKDDPSEPCFSDPKWSKAGCHLLKKIGKCYGPPEERPLDCNPLPVQNRAKLPKMIIYSGEYKPDLGIPAYAIGMTDRAGQLFELILNALEDRETKPRNDARADRVIE